MKKQKGFTLVELLVVIAIIALLMGILMPALARVRRSAQGTACMVQMKQWGTVFSMYTGDFDGYFHQDYDDARDTRIWWYSSLLPYYQDKDLLLCRAATKVRHVSGGQLGTHHDGGVNPYASYPIISDNAVQYKLSLTLNGWACQVSNWGRNFGRTPDRLWQTTNTLIQPNTIPIFADYWGYARSWAHSNTAPPPRIDTPSDDIDGAGQESTRLQNYVLRRHGPISNPNINVTFGDFSVRPVGLKALWSLRWHRQFLQERKDGTNGAPRTMADDVYAWPEWMKTYSSEGVINF